MKRRTKIRWIAFGAALITGLTVWGITGSATAKKQQRVLEAAQERALTQMCEYLDRIETDLTKTVYAGSPAMLSKLTNDLNTNASGAKTSLSALDAGSGQLYNLYKFLSQVSDYTQSLYQKVISGGTLTEKERVTVKKLKSYAGNLSKQFEYMTELLNSGCFSFEALDDELKQADSGSERMVSYLSAVNDAEESMSDFPTLIYDGPFSDNILQKESALLKGAPEISLAEAKAKAAKAMGVEERYVFSDSSSAGKLAAYNFHSDHKRAAVTIRGGYVAYVLSDDTAGAERLTGADAVQKAGAYLNALGYAQMVSTYYSVADGLCTVNFAYKAGEYICYPDLIKVSVSLSDGKVAAMDASDYLMNHTARSAPEPKLDAAAAAETVAENLYVLRSRPAVIPTEAGTENFTYELLCEDDAGQQVLVYVDTVSGEEDDILILLYADGGTLTK